MAAGVAYTRPLTTACTRRDTCSHHRREETPSTAHHRLHEARHPDVGPLVERRVPSRGRAAPDSLRVVRAQQPDDRHLSSRTISVISHNLGEARQRLGASRVLSAHLAQSRAISRPLGSSRLGQQRVQHRPVHAVRDCELEEGCAAALLAAVDQPRLQQRERAERRPPGFKYCGGRVTGAGYCGGRVTAPPTPRGCSWPSACGRAWLAPRTRASHLAHACMRPFTPDQLAGAVEGQVAPAVRRAVSRKCLGGV